LDPTDDAAEAWQRIYDDAHDDAIAWPQQLLIRQDQLEAWQELLDVALLLLVVHDEGEHPSLLAAGFDHLRKWRAQHGDAPTPGEIVA